MKLFKHPLSGASLSEANLSEADLIETNVRKADLSGAKQEVLQLWNRNGDGRAN